MPRQKPFASGTASRDTVRFPRRCSTPAQTQAQRAVRRHVVRATDGQQHMAWVERAGRESAGRFRRCPLRRASSRLSPLDALEAEKPHIAA